LRPDRRRRKSYDARLPFGSGDEPRTRAQLALELVEILNGQPPTNLG
jgi:hypothetical protein